MKNLKTKDNIGFIMVFFLAVFLPFYLVLIKRVGLLQSLIPTILIITLLYLRRKKKYSLSHMFIYGGCFTLILIGILIVFALLSRKYGFFESLLMFPY